MDNLSLNVPAGVLVKTTCVDFPGLVAGSFFLKGCNLRCPYCYNINLVTPSQKTDLELDSIQDLFNHLEKRQGILTGLVISGGEPLLNPYTPLIIKKAKSLGYKIKLDTNGTLPAELSYFLEAPELRPDFLAIDIKTTPEKYAKLICNKQSKFYGNIQYFEKVISESCRIAESIPADKREFRTVLVPSLVSLKEIQIIAKFLPKDASWQFVQFQNENCLNPEYKTIQPYLDYEIEQIITEAKKFIPNANLR